MYFPYPKDLNFRLFALKRNEERREALLDDLNESNHEPPSHFSPEFTGSHLQENLHVLQHRQPGLEPLLGQTLEAAHSQNMTTTVIDAVTTTLNTLPNTTPNQVKVGFIHEVHVLPKSYSNK